MKKRSRALRMQRPPQLHLDGWRAGGTVRTYPGGKPPKLRFRPGMFVEDHGQLYEILYAYRLRKDPHTWLFCLEERSNLEGKLDAIGTFLERMGAGKHTPRIVYELFADDYAAFEFFADIPAHGDQVTKSNQDMLKMRVVSSGQVS
jgi:hypothetical protein